MIFDVDGTVTLNDGLGHVGNVLGQSYVHEGVCEFLCLLRARGYQPLFLTVAHYVVHCVGHCVGHYVAHYIVRYVAHYVVHSIVHYVVHYVVHYIVHSRLQP